MSLSLRSDCKYSHKEIRDESNYRRGAIKVITMHYIDGAFVESHGREVMDIIRPTAGQVIGSVTLADEEITAMRAIAAAKRAFATYGRSTTDERAQLLRSLTRGCFRTRR